MPIKHCLIKVKGEFMIKLDQVKRILMAFHRRICLKIITQTPMGMTSVEANIKIWEDSNLFFKIFLENPLVNKVVNLKENLKIKEKT